MPTTAGLSDAQPAGHSRTNVTELRIAEKTVSVAAMLAACGGFLDAFTYIGHGGVFANAMTGNVVLLGAYSALGDWPRSLRHVPPILAFLSGIGAAQTILLPRLRPYLPHPALAVLGTEIAFLFLGGWLPKSSPDTPIVLTISFLASLQGSTFQKIQNWTFNSTMTTGNLKHFAEAAFGAAFSDRSRQSVQEALVFGTISISFLAGALLGGVCTARLQNRALWVVTALLLSVWLKLLLAWRQNSRPHRPPPLQA